MADAMSLFGALATGHLPERVPVCANLIDQGARELGITSQTYFSAAEHVTEGQLRLLKKYGHDVAWGAHFIARQAEILGAKRSIYPKEGPPNVGDLVIKSRDDIERFEVPADITAHPSFEIQARTIAMLREALGGKTPICAFQVGSFTLPVILMGMSGWMELLLTGPGALVEALLTKCSDASIAMFKAFKAAGADFVAYANPCASVEFFPLARIRRLALPWIARDTAGTEGAGLIYFSGGARIGETLPMLMEHTTLNMFYLNPFDDVAAAKTVVAGKGIVAAAVNDIALIDDDERTIRKNVGQLVQKGADGGGFFLGTLMMPCQIPEKNIHAMIAAAHEFGTYDRKV